MDAFAERRQTKPLTHRQTMVVILGMLLPTFMGSLDQTILATALPTIGREFDDFHDLPWLITAYLLIFHVPETVQSSKPTEAAPVEAARPAESPAAT